MLKIKDLHKKFGDLEILKGIDLEVKKGEVLAVIGPSGTGKSTLLRCLNYLERPEKGIITIDDVEVDATTATSKQIHNLRRKSAMVFQNYNLFKNMTVLENVMEPLVHVQKMHKKQAIEEARKYLEKVSLLDKENEYPAHLSGGQQQRAAIARTLAVKPYIILFDEPTAALDPSLVGEVMGVIRELAEQHTTMIVVTHEMRFARECADEIIFMANGKVVEKGNPKEIFEAPKKEETKKFLQLIEN